MSRPFFNGRLLLLANAMLYAAAFIVYLYLPGSWSLSWLIAGVAYASLMEYLAHRFIFHGKIPGLANPHWAHHQAFSAARMRYRDYNEWHLILYSPATTLAIILLGLAHYAVLRLVHLPAAALGVSAAIVTYFFLYEWLHLAFHAAPGFTRPIQPLRLLRHFHLMHHRLHRAGFRENFNVVLPLWDTIYRICKPR